MQIREETKTIVSKSLGLKQQSCMETDAAKAHGSYVWFSLGVHTTGPTTEVILHVN